MHTRSNCLADRCKRIRELFQNEISQNELITFVSLQKGNKIEGNQS